MYGKIIICVCLVASMASLVFGAPTKDRKLEKLSAILSTTTIRAKSESFEQIHVCVPNDECGDKEVVGINIVYTCSCHEGYTGEFCDQAITQTPQQSFHSFVELNRKPIKAKQLFHCEDKSTKCVNGVTVIDSKTAICSD